MNVDQFKKLSERDQFFAALFLEVIKAMKEVRDELSLLRREIDE